jgi:hypothetical protein
MYTQTSFMSPVCSMFQSTLAYILSISQECDSTGGDIKEVTLCPEDLDSWPEFQRSKPTSLNSSTS